MDLSHNKPDVTIDYMIAVMDASRHGKTVQEASRSLKNWCDVNSPSWNWNTFVYRIKPSE